MRERVLYVVYRHMITNPRSGPCMESYRADSCVIPGGNGPAKSDPALPEILRTFSYAEAVSALELALVMLR